MDACAAEGDHRVRVAGGMEIGPVDDPAVGWTLVGRAARLGVMDARLPGSHRAALEGYAERLRRRFVDRLRFVRLFGSWARGTAGPDSDIDVAVVIEGLTQAEWAEAVALAADSEIEGGEPLSPFVVSGERFDELVRRERRLATDVLREGVSL